MHVDQYSWAREHSIQAREAKVPTSVKLRGGNNIPHGVYDVKPNLAQFDEWTFEVIKMAKLREPMAECQGCKACLLFRAPED